MATNYEIPSQEEINEGENPPVNISMLKKNGIPLDLQAIFDTIRYIDEHKEAPAVSQNAGRFEHKREALLQALQYDDFDAYQQERIGFFRENPHAAKLFPAYNTTHIKRDKPTHQSYPEPTTPDLAKVRAYYSENELGDAHLFADVFKGRVCYDHTAKKWFLWTGHYWQRDTTGHIRILIAGKLGEVYLKAAAELNTPIAKLEQEINRLQNDSMVKNDEAIGPLQEKLKQAQAEVKQFSARVKDLRGSKRMNSVATFIQSLMGVTSGQWDTNPWLIGTSNGVIDLHDGTFHDGQPEDYIRTIIPTEWKGLDVQSPRFERFLQEIFADNPDKDAIIEFLQRLFGYGITGKTNNAIFPLLYGEDGRNGKDTLLGILKEVLGALVGAVSNDVFVSNDKFKSGGAATPHICDLQGKRLVWGSETKQGDKLNIAQLKLLTGGGDVSARQNYGEQFTFTPTHKLLLMTNYKPHADANDKAFWSRACLIPFGLRFVDEPKAANERKADPHLKETIQQEASGILAWLVRGCLAWQQQGLNIPQSIQMATEAYRKEEDNILQFIEDRCCIKDPKAHTKAKQLYDAYKVWSKDQTNFTMNNNQFGKAIEKMGFKKDHLKQGNVYIGIQLLAEDDNLFGPSKEK